MNTFLRIAAVIAAVYLALAGVDSVLIVSKASMSNAVSTAWAFTCIVAFNAYFAVRGFET